MYSDRASPWNLLGPRRLATAVSLDLRRSASSSSARNHYDHCDCHAAAAHGATIIVITVGNGPLLRSSGIRVELDWWQPRHLFRCRSR
jgi:hypothetical protein